MLRRCAGLKKTLVSLFSFVLVLFAVIGLSVQGSDGSSSGIQEHKQKFIILDSVNDRDYKTSDIRYMDENGKPALLPNFDLNKPVVITKMPLTESKEIEPNESTIK